MPDTLFRFVTVRNPRKLTRQERRLHFITYDADLHAPLVERVVGVIGQLQEEGRYEHLQFLTSISQLVANDDVRPLVFEDEHALRHGAEHLDEWLALLEENRGTPDIAAVRSTLRDHDLSSSPELERKLWDSLLAASYSGLKQNVRDAAIWALRAVHLRRTAESRDLKQHEVDAIAGATVVLPYRLPQQHIGFELPDDTKPADEEGPQAPAERDRIAEQYGRLRKLNAAAAELQDVQDLQIRIARFDHSEGPALPGSDCREPEPSKPADADGMRLDHRLLQSLSKETQQILEEHGLERGVPVAAAIARLEKKSHEFSERVALQSRASVKVHYAGGALWTRSNFIPAHSDVKQPKHPIGRLDDDYDGMYPRPQCRIRPLGIADFRRVEQELYCYEPGEVAHIENILQGEAKRRETRRLERNEDTLIVAQENETTDERDTQTTDRYEMERETNKVVESSLAFELGVAVAASYGPVKIEVNSNLTASTSTVESAKKTASYAKEVTERARRQVVEKIREERISTTIREFEEKNAHELNNVGGTGHVVGLYRWVNKKYKAWVVNYGKRLMVEFMIPEPGAFHLHAMAEAPVEEGLRLDLPIDPRSDDITTLLGVAPIRESTDINTSNYSFWAALYDADVDPPPPYEIQLSRAFGREGMDHTVQFSAVSNEIVMPEGYEAAAARWRWGLHSENHDGGNNWLTIMVGQESTFATSGSHSGWRSLGGEDDVVPVSIMGRTRMYAVNVEIRCARTPEHLDAWRQKTFTSIIAGYQNKLNEYNNALAEAQARGGVTIRGTNPAMNRSIEQVELKKGAIRLMTRCVPTWSDAMKDGTSENCFYPEFDCCEAIRDGAYVQFVEQAFEWSLMTYLFYPYFWGRKCNWSTVYRLEDTDPIFLAFLQAGFARVVVPVREGYEQAVMRFLVDGVPWSGGEVPGIDSEMYLSIVNEMKEPVGQIDPDIEPWFIDLPTSLTALQCESGCIEGRGLPCPGGDAEVGVGEVHVLGNAPARDGRSGDGDASDEPDHH